MKVEFCHETVVVFHEKEKFPNNFHTHIILKIVRCISLLPLNSFYNFVYI